MNPRTVLRLLIERLAPEVGHVRRGDYAYWDTPGEAAAAMETGRRGHLHLATALREAREALATDDDAIIAQAAITCLAFERTGRTIAATHAVATKARSAGKGRGAQQAAEAEARWRPYVEMFHDMLGRGADQAKARAHVERMIEAAHQSGDPDWPTMPDARTMRRRLKK